MKVEDVKIESKKIEKEMSHFVVIGLGRFGRSLASTLAGLGKEVLVVDTDPQAVKKIENQVTSAIVADSSKSEVLYSLGVQNFDCAIVCIGNDLEASILTTLICKDLGVSYVVVKAQNDQHKRVLERIGADMVVFPEVYMGKKVANMLSNPSMNQIMNLTDNFKIVEVANPDSWNEKTILETNIRKKYKVTIIFVKRENEVLYPEPETVLQKGDILVIAGETTKLELLSSQASEVIDVNHSLQDALTSE